MVMKYQLVELWNTRRLDFILVVGGLILNIALSLILFGGILPGLARDRAELMQRRAGMSRSETDGSNMVPARMSDQLQSFYRQVAAYEKFPDFIKQLYQYSENSGLNIQRITYRPQKTDLSTVIRYDLEFSVTGTYLQIKKFLQALENWPQLVVVEQVRLAAQQPERDAVVLSIRLAAYFNTVSP